MGTLKFQAIEFRRDSRWTLGTAYTLVFSPTGNLEIRRAATETLVWQSGTNGDRLVMQEDGNLVIYGADGAAAWATNSSGNRNAVLLARDDASLEIVSEDGVVVWRATIDSAEPEKPAPAAAPALEVPEEILDEENKQASEESS